MNNRAATLIGSSANIGRDINKVFSAPCREESTATKSPLPCPNTVKQHNKSIKGFFSCDKYIAPYRTDRQSKRCLCLRIVFDLMDFAIVNSFIVYDKL